MNKPDQQKINTPESLNRSYIAPEIVRQRQRTIESLDIKVGESILDIGCGTGFLTYEMALIVGQQGQVTGMDISQPMVEHTLERCSGMDHVSASVGDVGEIDAAENSFDIVTCTQVLLYVENTEQAIREIFRVLKPGGRLAIIETDWRGVVMSGSYPELTEKIMKAWDQTVASPNLPPRLPGILRRQDFYAVKTEAIPLLNTSFSPNSFSVGSLEWLCKTAYKQGMITKEEGKMWVADQEQLGADNDYLFCLNRFLFTAVKP